MRKCLLFILIFLPCFADAATINATSCSYADVLAAVNAATSGDTVQVPAGICTWTSALTINKGIILKGAGADQVYITSEVASKAYTVVYAPANPELNEAFRMTGFSFNFKKTAFNLHLKNKNQSIINKIRVDHNIFNNCGTPFLTVNGPVYGVVDNNILNGSPHLDNYAQDSCADWEKLPFVYGSSENLYYEDNDLTTNETVTSGGHGGSYAYRYNDITINRTGTGSITPIFDMHGNQPATIVATRGGEIYGNDIKSTNPSLGAVFVAHRGGQMLAFFNKLSGFSGSVNSKLSEEYGHETYCNGLYKMNINNSYYWNNRTPLNLSIFTEKQFTNKQAIGGGTNYIEAASISQFCVSTCYYNAVKILSGKGVGQRRMVSSVNNNRIIVTQDWEIIPDNTSIFEVVIDCCNNIHPDKEFFIHNISFNGTSGVGCGSFLTRPATCVEGVGYWATDQSCIGVDDINIGINPASPIEGTLYKCTSPNTWTAYYTPLAYPHPLRTNCTMYPSLCDADSQPTCTILGDLSCNQKVDAPDIQIAINVFLGLETNQERIQRSDVNTDSKTDILDIQKIVNLFLGIM